MCFRFEDKKERQDICVETEMHAPSDDHPPQQDNVSEEIDAPDSAKSELEAQAEKTPVQLEELLRSWDQSSTENVGQRYGERIAEANREKSSSWWKDSGQTILRFFAKILGKRVSMTANRPTECVIPNGKMRIKNASKNGRSRHGHKRVTAEGIRLRRVSNGYIATHANR